MHFIKSIVRMVPRWIRGYNLEKGEIVFAINPNDNLRFARFLKLHTNCQYKQLIDVTAVDYPSREKRFKVVYQYLSISHNSRLRVHVAIDSLTPLESLSTPYPSAIWWEREVWDMFGLFFSNHPDLRRILTDYGFRGHPLRKDFPLTGFVEVRYGDIEKRVITEKVEVSQEFRYFDFQTPWEQIKKVQ